MQENRKKIYVVAYLGCFMILFAVIASMFSTILPKITERYALTLTQVSTFTIVQNYVANFIGTFFLVGWGDRFPKGIVIGVDAVLLALLLLLIDALPPYLLLMIAFSALHLSTGIINNMVTAFIADLYGEKRSRYISMMHIFYSIGALFGPKFPQLIEKMGFGWNTSYAVMAALFLVVTAAYFVTMTRTHQLSYRLDKVDTPKVKQASEYRLLDILKHPMFISLCLLQTVYMSGHQNLFGNWFQLFLQRSYPEKYTASFTATCMTVYWFGMLGSRLISMITAEKVTPVQFITVGSAVGVLAQLLGLFGNTPALWVVTCLLLGLCTGGIYPLTFSISISYFPKNSARITSLMGIVSSIGGILLSMLMGRLAEASMFLAMFLPVACLLFVFALIRLRFAKQPQQTA